MVNQAEEPLEKVSLNLFEADVHWLRTHVGDKWTRAVRDLVRESIKQMQGDKEYD